MQRRAPSISRGILSSIGNTADNLAILSEGVAGKGFLKGTAQATKNVGNLLKRNVGSSLYREIETGQVIQKNGKNYIKSKFPLFSDREIISTTERGSHIIRKRKALTPLTLAATAPGLGAVGFAIGSKEGSSPAKNLSHSAIETGAFAVSTPLGIASTFLRKPKSEVASDTALQFKKKNT